MTALPMRDEEGKLKAVVFEGLICLCNMLCRSWKIFSNPKKQERAALVLPPASGGSLGDEAIVGASVRCLRKRGVRRIGLISYGEPYRWPWIHEVSEAVDLGNYLAYGSWRDRLRFIWIAFRFDSFYCLGADVLDGFYSEKQSVLRLQLAALAARIGIKSSIVGFSVNGQIKPASLEAFQRLPESVRLFCRDAISAKRLAEAINRPVGVRTDPAFLLVPNTAFALVPHVGQWVRRMKAQERFVIGINASITSFRSLAHVRISEIVTAYKEGLETIAAENGNMSFLFIPHDFRGRMNDALINQAILDSLGPEIREFSMIPTSVYNAVDAKGLVRNLDFVFTGRLHLAIACLSQGIPAAVVAYQGKTEGIYQQFELRGLSITPEGVLSKGVLSRFLMDGFSRREAVRSKLNGRLEEVYSMAEANFL